VDLDEVVRELAPKVLRYSRIVAGDRHAGDDVAQDALTALVRHWRARGAPDSPAAFVFTIARRRAIRSAVRRRLFAPLETLAFAPGPEPSPERVAIDRDGHRRLRAALARLPSRDRDTLLLVTVGGVSTADAAKVLGVTASAVKMRTSRARERLAAWIGETDEPAHSAGTPRSAAADV
jgi:RNA polymerase sigma-70 factor (ECF subfamily)